MPLAVLAGGLHLAGGLLIGLGWLTRWAAAALTIDVGIGLWLLHLKWGFFLNYSNAPGQGHGIEYTVVLLGALLALILAGAGDLSIDGVRAKGAQARAAGKARLRGKV
jgi:putative oxidoreductase